MEALQNLEGRSSEKFGAVHRTRNLEEENFEKLTAEKYALDSLII